MKKLKSIKKCFALVSSVTLIGLLSQTSLAEKLNSVAITGEQAGEITLVAEEVTLAPWHSDALSGKARTVLHMAGRMSSRKMQDHFIDALKAAELDEQYYQTTSIVDLSDAIWGTTGFVESKLEDNKRQFPWSSIVLDRSGAFRSAHDLTEKSSAVYILNAEGKVMFSQEGPLSPQAINAALSLLREEVERLKNIQAARS